MALGSTKWALESQVRIACVFALVWPHRRGISGQEEIALGFDYAVHGWSGSGLTSSDVIGVVVMASQPSAVPNGPWGAKCGLRVFCRGLTTPTRHFGSRS